MKSNHTTRSKTNLHRQVARNLAAMRIQSPDQREVAWRQYGQPIVDLYPRDEWSQQLRRVPAIYRSLVQARLLREYGETLELLP